jgi:hypothetical protein
MPQVAKSAPRTLSRWRHGFEPRWDYSIHLQERLSAEMSLNPLYNYVRRPHVLPRVESG